MQNGRRDLGGAGTSTSAIAVGGQPTPSKAETELWNGTNWTEVADLNFGRIEVVAAGASNTAVLAFGGIMDNVSDSTESWNGSNWTEVNQMSRPLGAMRYAAGCGIQTAALSFGGGGPTRALTETWNGTNWTETGDLNTGRSYLAGAGTNTAALAFGGTPGSGETAATEEFNVGPATITKTISTS